MNFSAEAIFNRYRDDRRDQPIEGFTVEVLPYLSRYTATTPGAQGFVVFADLPLGEEEEIIAEQIRHFAQREQRFEWKLFDFDRPADLVSRLRSRGFHCDAPEAFMVLPTADWNRVVAVPAGIRIERITDERGLQHVVDVQGEAFDDPFDWLFENYATVLRESPESVAMYCAYRGDQPVGTGWIDFPKNSSFAELHGGCVLPEQRGQGLFSALVDRRMRDARARHYEFVAVDAAPMSRPILERQGFQHVCFTHPLRLA